MNILEYSICWNGQCTMVPRGPKSLKLLYSIMNLYQGKANKVLQGFFRILFEVSDYICRSEQKKIDLFFFPQPKSKHANGRKDAWHMEVMDPLSTRLTSTNQSHEAFKCVSSCAGATLIFSISFQLYQTNKSLRRVKSEESLRLLMCVGTWEEPSQVFYLFNFGPIPLYIVAKKLLTYGSSSPSCSVTYSRWKFLTPFF